MKKQSIFAEKYCIFGGVTVYTSYSHGNIALFQIFFYFADSKFLKMEKRSCKRRRSVCFLKDFRKMLDFSAAAACNYGNIHS